MSLCLVDCGAQIFALIAGKSYSQVCHQVFAQIFQRQSLLCLKISDEQVKTTISGGWVWGVGSPPLLSQPSLAGV